MAYSSTQQLASVSSTQVMLGASFVTTAPAPPSTAINESSLGVARRLRRKSVALGAEWRWVRCRGLAESAPTSVVSF